MRCHRQHAFTLIELMIVVAIIGIMATYAVPTFQDFIIRSQIEEGIHLADSLKKNITDYYRQNKRFPADNTAAAVPLPEHLIGNYVTGIYLQNGALHIHLGNRVNRQVRDKILTLRPAYVSASPDSPISWICGHAEAVPGMTAQGDDNTTVPPLYLPIECRSWKTQSSS